MTKGYPQINVEFRTEDPDTGIVGTTSATVHSGRIEDDGSITVYLDHWPERTPLPPTGLPAWVSSDPLTDSEMLDLVYKTTGNFGSDTLKVTSTLIDDKGIFYRAPHSNLVALVREIEKHSRGDLPEDPNNWRLPFTVEDEGFRIRQGVRLKTLITRMRSLSASCRRLFDKTQEQRKAMDDLAYLITKMAYQLRKVEPADTTDHKYKRLSDEALFLLKKYGLKASPLRDYPEKDELLNEESK